MSFVPPWIDSSARNHERVPGGTARLIIDLDDTASKPYGEWYADDNPLTLEKMLPPAG